MKASPNNRKIGLLLLLLVVLAAAVVIRVRPALLESVGGTGGAAPRVGSYTVPKMPWSDGSERTADAGVAKRNIFTFGAPPTPTPDLRPTPTPAPTLPPRPRPTPTPAGVLMPDGSRLPPPPRFSMAYLGWLGPDRLPVGVFRNGSDVLAVPRGDRISDVFILRDVGPADATIGFVGYPESVSAKVQLSR